MITWCGLQKEERNQAGTGLVPVGPPLGLRLPMTPSRCFHESHPIDAPPGVPMDNLTYLKIALESEDPVHHEESLLSSGKIELTSFLSTSVTLRSRSYDWVSGNTQTRRAEDPAIPCKVAVYPKNRKLILDYNLVVDKMRMRVSQAEADKRGGLPLAPTREDLAQELRDYAKATIVIAYDGAGRPLEQYVVSSPVLDRKAEELLRDY